LYEGIQGRKGSLKQVGAPIEHEGNEEIVNVGEDEIDKT
jgi:hypothetical protein